MIFTAENVEKILSGTKVQTRRMVKPGDHVHSHAMFTASADRCADGQSVPWVDGEYQPRWAVGKTYAVQSGRGKHAVGRIEITEIRYCERASDISESDARAEGFDDAESFCAYYAKLNGAAALERPAWALDFSLVEEEEAAR